MTMWNFLFDPKVSICPSNTFFNFVTAPNTGSNRNLFSRSCIWVDINKNSKRFKLYVDRESKRELPVKYIQQGIPSEIFWGRHMSKITFRCFFAKMKLTVSLLLMQKLNANNIPPCLQDRGSSKWTKKNI